MAPRAARDVDRTTRTRQNLVQRKQKRRRFGRHAVSVTVARIPVPLVLGGHATMLWNKHAHGGDTVQETAVCGLATRVHANLSRARVMHSGCYDPPGGGP